MVKKLGEERSARQDVSDLFRRGGECTVFLFSDILLVATARLLKNQYNFVEQVRRFVLFLVYFYYFILFILFILFIYLFILFIYLFFFFLKIEILDHHFNFLFFLFFHLSSLAPTPAHSRTQIRK